MDQQCRSQRPLGIPNVSRLLAEVDDLRDPEVGFTECSVAVVSCWILQCRVNSLSLSKIWTKRRAYLLLECARNAAAPRS